MFAVMLLKNRIVVAVVKKSAVVAVIQLFQSIPKLISKPSFSAVVNTKYSN